MVDTFFGPGEKSSEYWDRERTALGRTRNDEIDHQERLSAHRKMIASGYTASMDRQIHNDLWKSDAEDKAFWRADFQKTGKLLMPAEHHRLDEPAPSESVGLQVGRQVLAGLIEEDGAEDMAGASIILPPPESEGSHVQREARRAAKNLQRAR